MDLADFELERFFARWEFDVQHLLCASDCESMTVGELLAMADVSPETLLATPLGYGDSQGDPRLRTAIAARTPGLTAEQLVVTSAPQEGIFLAMSALLQPGDRVVVTTPCYQSLAEVGRARGCEIVPWPVRPTATGWSLDLDELETLAAGATMVVVNFPHNPTGYLPSRSTFESLADIVQRQGAWLFSDEMYRGLEPSAAQRLPSAAQLDHERTVSLGGLSKAYGLPGLRIGWLA
ncbi:MAG: pyridoxal phosphate-dependent aminotransferase, partial [Deltaproteobacteria bacterium]|nr:pyridoxal phosphate-dependent aminotransferase [Deltaproteobacteria bacterium]